MNPCYPYTSNNSWVNNSFRKSQTFSHQAHSSHHLCQTVYFNTPLFGMGWNIDTSCSASISALSLPPASPYCLCLWMHLCRFRLASLTYALSISALSPACPCHPPTTAYDTFTYSAFLSSLPLVLVVLPWLGLGIFNKMYITQGGLL